MLDSSRRRASRGSTVALTGADNAEGSDGRAKDTRARDSALPPAFARPVRPPSPRPAACLASPSDRLPAEVRLHGGPQPPARDKSWRNARVLGARQTRVRNPQPLPRPRITTSSAPANERATASTHAPGAPGPCRWCGLGMLPVTAAADSRCYRLPILQTDRPTDRSRDPHLRAIGLRPRT